MCGYLLNSNNVLSPVLNGKKNKGKLQEAINAEQNLITSAHNIVKKDILLPAKTVTTDENIDMYAALSLKDPTVNEVGACI